MAAKAASEEVDVLESWEDIEESGILDRSLKLPDSSPEEPERMSTATNNGPVILQTNRQFHPGQGVKILKRPPRNVHSNSNGPLPNGDLKPKQPIKTLQQREQEYAEARLRILGEARSPEETLQQTTDERIQKIQNKMEALRTEEAANIIRLPKGPDGTRGFNLRRSISEILHAGDEPPSDRAFEEETSTRVGVEERIKQREDEKDDSSVETLETKTQKENTVDDELPSACTVGEKIEGTL